MFILKLIRKLFKGLSGAESPNQIAIGLGLGLTLGLVPLSSGLGILLLMLIFVTRVSFPFATVAWGLAAALRAAVIAGMLADIGFWILWKLPLTGFWSFVLTLPGIALLGLDRHSVMGGAVVGILLGAALFFPVRYLVVRYREVVVAKLSNSRFFKYLMKLWIVRALRWILVGAVR